MTKICLQKIFFPFKFYLFRIIKGTHLSSYPSQVKQISGMQNFRKNAEINGIINILECS